MDGKDFSLIREVVSKETKQAGEEVLITINEDLELCGDIFFKFKNHKNKKFICRISLNTSFIDR